MIVSDSLAVDKRTQVGTQPIELHTLMHQGVPHVFASSDYPTIISYTGNQLLFTPVNTDAVRFSCYLLFRVIQSMFDCNFHQIKRVTALDSVQYKNRYDCI